RRRHTRCLSDWSSDVCSSDLDRHYNGTVEQIQRQEAHTNVVNDQRIIDLSATYQFNKRLGLSMSVPLVDSSWSIPLPLSPTLGRSEERRVGKGCRSGEAPMYE